MAFGAAVAAQIVLASLGGCRSVSGQAAYDALSAVPSEVQVPASFDVAPGAYPAAFDAVRDELTRRRFVLDRVDARNGVITTLPKGTAGLATPWDTEQSRFGQEFDDGLNQQERVVRVTFEPAGGLPAVGGDPGAALPDLREHAGAMVGRVEVEMLRVRRPGWRLETESIRRSSRTSDPDLARAGMGGVYRTGAGPDEALGQRVARAVSTRLSGG